MANAEAEASAGPSQEVRERCLAWRQYIFHKKIVGLVEDLQTPGQRKTFGRRLFPQPVVLLVPLPAELTQQQPGTCSRRTKSKASTKTPAPKTPVPKSPGNPKVTPQRIGKTKAAAAPPKTPVKVKSNPKSQSKVKTPVIKLSPSSGKLQVKPETCGKGRGRPKGSGKKNCVVKVPSGRSPGRPKGSGKKNCVVKVPSGKGRGRPKGSTKKKAATLTFTPPSARTKSAPGKKIRTGKAKMKIILSPGPPPRRSYSSMTPRTISSVHTMTLRGSLKRPRSRSPSPNEENQRPGPSRRSKTSHPSPEKHYQHWRPSSGIGVKKLRGLRNPSVQPLRPNVDNLEDVEPPIIDLVDDDDEALIMNMELGDVPDVFTQEDFFDSVISDMSEVTN